MSKTSWRALTTEWFRREYPDCDITEINAAVGGTGTDLGVFRCERDLISKEPDLVFFDFTTNDSGNVFEEVLPNTEAIFRKIYTANPNAEIIGFIGIGKAQSDRLNEGGIYLSRSTHTFLMQYYGIPMVDAGEVLRYEVAKQGGDWLKLTKDYAHPLDCGYAVYANTVIEFLKKQLSCTADKLTAKVLPRRISGDNRESAYMVNACEAIGNVAGWKRVNQSLCRRYDNYIEADSPGAEFTWHFTGCRIGFYLMMAADSGDLCYRIDNGEEKRLRTWDEYCIRFDRAQGMVLPEKLSDGEHTITVRVSEEKAEESTGTAIRIGAFLLY